MAANSVKLLSGANMPLLGFGTFLCEKEVTKASVLKALEVGYRHIDTAYVYQNEDHIGEALTEAFEKKIVKREDLFITTKLPSNGHAKDKVQYFLKKSLSKLQLSYVDLYLVHVPLAFKHITDDDPMNQGNDFDNETTHMDTWRAMEECMDAGLTKSIGLSNFNSKQIQSVFDQARIKPSNLQVECHINFQQEKLFNFCKNLGITFTAYAPFANPAVLDKRFTKDVTVQPKVLENPVLIEIGKKYGKTTAQVALRWLTQRGMITIPKSQTPSRIEANFQIFDFILTEEEMKKIKGEDRNLRGFLFNFYPSLLEHPNFPFHEEF